MTHHLPFLEFPITVREHIYTELLVPPIVQVDECTNVQEPPATAILCANKQIYAESSDILYTKNLLTVVNTNDIELFSDFRTQWQIPVLCVVKNPAKIAQCYRFALTMEILGIGLKLAATGTPTFIITAHALPFFANGIIRGHRFTSDTGSVIIRVQNTFRYTIPRFSALVFGRFLNAKQLPKFAALRIEGPISESYRHRMMRNCLSEENDASGLQKHACSLQILGIDCYLNQVYRMRMHNGAEENDSIKDEILEQQIHELPRLVLRKLDIFWDNHEYKKRALGHVCGLDPASFFCHMAKAYDTLIYGYFFLAKVHPERAVHLSLEARCAAEEAINFLNQDNRIAFAEMLEYDDNGKPELIKPVDRAKARLSLKASKACSKLGDREAANTYVQEANLYNPNMEPEIREKITKIRLRHVPDLPTGSPRIKPAVLWRKLRADEPH